MPIDRYSYEAVELLKDIVARWKTLRQDSRFGAFVKGKDARGGECPSARRNADLYAIDVSFPALEDKAELAYLNDLPTSFVLPDEAVDRLRAAAGTIILESPDFQRLLKDAGARIVDTVP